MTSLSIRLPEELESRLSQEAIIEGKGRSEVARDAIAEYVKRKERERFMSDIVAAARSLGDDPGARSEILEMAQDLVNEGLGPSIENGRKKDPANDRKWWK